MNYNHIKNLSFPEDDNQYAANKQHIDGRVNATANKSN